MQRHAAGTILRPALAHQDILTDRSLPRSPPTQTRACGSPVPVPEMEGCRRFRPARQRRNPRCSPDNTSCLPAPTGSPLRRSCCAPRRAPVGITSAWKTTSSGRKPFLEPTDFVRCAHRRHRQYIQSPQIRCPAGHHQRRRARIVLPRIPRCSTLPRRGLGSVRTDNSAAGRLEPAGPPPLAFSRSTGCPQATGTIRNSAARAAEKFISAPSIFSAASDVFVGAYQNLPLGEIFCHPATYRAKTR